ncbi:sensor histidine kinase [Cohnella sp. REN36]|uniref:cache domain-containing sensor histidine kinase n=1 Tax=Cohnella sp. REN36 TaxID=2887347 RepID=UPI001D133AA2|nr:sensor histidine kinase [Cohnella sp. REN36]MCC3373896.1 sensor histidine kinase [Cohnella sp. REN36]
MSLGKRMFTAFFVFIILPLFVLGTVSYLAFQHITEKKYTEQMELSMNAIGRNLNNMIKEANYFSDFWVTTEDSVESVKQSIVPERGKSAGGDNTYDDLVEKQKLTRRVLLTYPGIKSVTMYRNNGRVVSVDFIQDQPIPIRDLQTNPIYQEVLRKNGAPVWIGPNEDRELTGINNLFTQIRVVLDINTLQSQGILVIRFQMNELNRTFEFYNTEGREDRRYLIVGRGGTVVYDSHKTMEGHPFQKEMDRDGKLDLKRNFETKTMTFDGQKSLVSVHNLGDIQRLGTGDWTLVTVTNWKYLSGDMAVMLRWVVLITAACIACALIFNLMFIRRTVHFFVRVANAMRRVERGDLTTRVPVEGNDETVILAKGFNSLVGRVSELLDDVTKEQRRKRKAEMMLLQAQIKPHFLFNALESINILAVQNEGRKVSKMVQRLGNIFRISIQQKEEIRIEQELEHLRSYLEIQKFRFEELFDYEIDVPADLLPHPILKLTLQPLVENSIQHGFEGIDYFGRITVRAREENGNIAFYVEDNGIGIPHEQLAKFASSGVTTLEQMYEESPETGERRGLGVGNVADRLRIHYGAGYGLFLCSSPGQGTVIKCVIPMQAGSETDEAKGAIGG